MVSYIGLGLLFGVGLFLTILTIDRKHINVFFVGIILMIFSMYGIGLETYYIGYKKGQIDCINGGVNYELQIHEDNTSSWELIEID